MFCDLYCFYDVTVQKSILRRRVNVMDWEYYTKCNVK